MPTVWVSAQCSVEVDGEVDDGLVLECDIVTCTVQVCSLCGPQSPGLIGCLLAARLQTSLPLPRQLPLWPPLQAYSLSWPGPPCLLLRDPFH